MKKTIKWLNFSAYSRFSFSPPTSALKPIFPAEEVWLILRKIFFEVHVRVKWKRLRDCTLISFFPTAQTFYYKPGCIIGKFLFEINKEKLSAFNLFIHVFEGNFPHSSSRQQSAWMRGERGREKAKFDLKYKLILLIFRSLVWSLSDL